LDDIATNNKGGVRVDARNDTAQLRAPRPDEEKYSIESDKDKKASHIETDDDEGSDYIEGEEWFMV